MATADFSSATSAWRRGLGNVRNVVRQELVHRQLAAHLPYPDPEKPVRVLDIGCGQGTQLVRLARLGYQVSGLDPSDELLALAADALAKEKDEVQGRVELYQGAIEHWPLVGAAFDVTCCHGVVMYLPSLEGAIRELVRATRPGGVISVLSKNRANLALRSAMRGDWEGAIAAFDARSYTNRLGVEHARADDPEEVIDALSRSGADTLAWYGVRLFTDHWGDIEAPEELEVILRVEEEAGRRDPYRRLAAATHVIARRRNGRPSRDEMNRTG